MNSKENYFSYIYLEQTLQCSHNVCIHSPVTGCNSIFLDGSCKVTFRNVITPRNHAYNLRTRTLSLMYLIQERNYLDNLCFLWAIYWTYDKSLWNILRQHKPSYDVIPNSASFVEANENFTTLQEHNPYKTETLFILNN